jgi:hypothetical protein
MLIHRRRRPLQTTTIAIVACVVSVTALTLSLAAAPEDEIARLNRVRQTLFQDLVKARSDVAAARAEAEVANKALQQAEAELEHLRAKAVAADATEREIARLDRVRQTLFADLVKARSDAAAVRAELEAVRTARTDDQDRSITSSTSEGTPSAVPQPEPVQATSSVAPQSPSKLRPAGAPSRPTASETKRRDISATASTRVMRLKPASPERRGANPGANDAGLPSVLRLQDRR